MRTKALFLSAALVAAGVASSMAQSNVYSLNVVGYVNVTLHNGGYNLIANPLDTGTNTYDNLFGPGSSTPLPSTSVVLSWDPIGATFNSATRTPFGTHWNPTTSGTNIASPGTGLFVLLPAGSDLTNTFVGTVVQGTLTNSFVPGYNLVANIAPVGSDVNTIGLTNVPSSSVILQWDPIGQAYNTTHTKTPFGFGWNPPTLPTFAVGEGFFLNAPSSFNWVQTFVVQ